MAPRWTFAEKSFARNHSYREYVQWTKDTGRDARNHQSWKDIRRTRVQSGPQPVEIAPGDDLQSRVIDQSTQDWQDAQVALQRLGRPVRLAKVADQHHPYADPAALDLAMQIVHEFEPDVLPALDDFFDFPSFSSFASARPAFKLRWDGNLENAVEHHRAVMASWSDVAPDAVMPSLMGNHERRLWRYLRKNASAASEYALGKFIEDLTSHGILFLGEDADELELSPGLIIMHGRYATKNTATALKNTMDLYGYHRNVLMGHIHRLASLTKSGADYTVTAMASGCLTELRPHYNPRHQNWQHGIALAYYDSNSRDTALYNVEFIRSGGYLRAFWNQKEFRSKLARED